MAGLEDREDWDGPYFQRLSGRIRTGRYSPTGLKRALAARTHVAGPAYDALDTLATGLLLPSPGSPSVGLDPDMVAYQPAPLRQILALIDSAQVGPSDHLYDLGSGLGQAAILAALLSGARATGVEIEPAYVESAQRSAARLGLSSVDFIQGDAREASLTGGTVYFLYTPFRGPLLRQVSERLKVEAAQRPIRVCSLGPCTAELQSAGWKGSRRRGPDEVEVFQA